MSDPTTPAGTWRAKLEERLAEIDAEIAVAMAPLVAERAEIAAILSPKRQYRLRTQPYGAIKAAVLAAFADGAPHRMQEVLRAAGSISPVSGAADRARELGLVRVSRGVYQLPAGAPK